MLQKHQNKLSMWRAVYKTLTKHNAVWAGVPALAAAYSRLNVLIEIMERAGAGQQTPTTGMTLDKYQAEEEAIMLVVEVAGAARAYAIDEENNDLYARVNVTHNSLERLPDNELRDKLTNIMEAITPLQTALADTGVTADDITAANDAVTAYREQIAAPRTVIAGRKTDTESMPGILRTTRSLLDKVDGLTVRFQRTNPVFVSDYKNSRIVVDAGIRHDDKGSTGDKPTT